MSKNSRFNDRDIEVFKKLVEEGLTMPEIANNIGDCTVFQVRNFLRKNNLKTKYSYNKLKYDKNGIPIQYCKCGIKLNKTNAFWHNKKNKWQYSCKKCRKKMSSDRWKKNKKRAVEYKGGKCGMCGYDKCLDVLEFHHINPKEKSNNFRNLKIISWESQKEELDKCILLCANCHRETHNELNNLKKQT